MAEKYGVTEYKATEYVVDQNGCFTGEIIKMWDSKNKQIAINRFVDRYDVDLDLSYSYGDTTGDLSMLKMVGHPITINPIRRLLMTIKQDEQLYNKIKIIVERKDVIYKLNPDVEILDL